MTCSSLLRAFIDFDLCLLDFDEWTTSALLVRLFNDADGGVFTAMTRLVLLDSGCFFCDEDADFIGGSTLLHLTSIPLGDDTVVLAVFKLFVVVGGGATTDGS